MINNFFALTAKAKKKRDKSNYSLMLAREIE